MLLIPTLTTVSDGAFLADDTLLGGYELGGGWLRIEPVKVGKHAFVGNSGMAAPGRRVPKQGLVAVLSAAPRRTKAKAGTSWLGSPPTSCGGVGRRRHEPHLPAGPAATGGARRGRGLRLAAVVAAVVIGVGAVVALDWLTVPCRLVASGPPGGLVLVAGRSVAALWPTLRSGCSSAGCTRAIPALEAFVWRNELADTFVEVRRRTVVRPGGNGHPWRTTTSRCRRCRGRRWRSCRRTSGGWGGRFPGRPRSVATSTPTSTSDSPRSNSARGASNTTTGVRRRGRSRTTGLRTAWRGPGRR